MLDVIITSTGLLCVIVCFAFNITTVVILINDLYYIYVFIYIYYIIIGYHWCVFSFVDYAMLPNLRFTTLLFPMMLLPLYHFIITLTSTVVAIITVIASVSCDLWI